MASRFLLSIALAHGLLALALACALRFEAPAVMGVHPALKPLKFAVSIGIFLASMAVFLDEARWSANASGLVAATLGSTMIVEMGCILVQAARGTSSHFNTSTPFDAAIWTTMFVAIVIATLTMLGVAGAAMTTPFEGTSALRAWAWRLGLWLFLLAAVSGFGMGGRAQHGVGGLDGGPGRVFTNWSTRHGDLRVPHFFALHVLQILPVAAWFLDRAPFSPALRGSLFFGVAAGAIGVCLFTLKQAFSGQPFLR